MALRSELIFPDSSTEDGAPPDPQQVCDRLCADLVERWRRGERVPVEAYFRQHPGFEQDDGAFELVLTEVILRQECGIAAPLPEFLFRFPRFETQLRRHFDLHAGLTADGDEFATSLEGVPAVAETAPEWPVVPGYEITEQIGHGGMGIVYRAREPSLGRQVALKVLREEHTGESDRMARFLREARTASALNHPGICTIHSLGEYRGRPFIVMELVEGMTLRTLAQQPPELDELVRLIGQTAEALSAAHAAGVVHRDIKPENIMARADGRVKVLDFGLARLLPEGLLAGSISETAPGGMAGTMAYMSPEQTRCESVGSASDLFSLGIVAYELATGRHPFLADSVVATSSAIASQPPIPLRTINPALSVEFESLVLQMLEKDPHQRPTAAEVVAASGRVFGSRLRTPGADRRAREVRTVGREREFASVCAAYEQIESGGTSMLCVTGEPGIGKTTLVEDWLRELTASGCGGGIGRGRCSERLAGTGSYLPILQALEGLLRGEAGSLAGRLMRHLARSWYAQITPHRDSAATEQVSNPAETSSQERMKREFLSFVTELGRHLPVVLFLDDLHWADASTVDLLAWIGRQTGGLRLLVVVTYRPGEMLAGDNHFAEVQLELERHGACRELPLAFLSRDEVDRYLSLVFPEHQFPGEFSARLHANTEGNPLFLVELVHHLQNCGVIARRGGHWQLTGAVPDVQAELPISVRSLIRRQLDLVAEDDRRLLSVGSVQGYEFDAGVVAAALGLPVVEVEERLTRLDRVHALVRIVREQEFPDGSLTLRFRFVHVIYQNSLYAALSPARRIEWSAAVAEALLGRYRNQRHLVAGELGLLFENAREWDRAAEHFLLAVRNPFRLHAHREAAVLARRGLQMLEHLPETAERARREVPLRFALGMALQTTEGFADPDVIEVYRRARALRHVNIEAASRSPLLWGLWSFHLLRGEHDAALEIARELCALAEGQTDPLISLPAHHSMGYTLLMLGQPTAAWSHLERDLTVTTHAVYGRDLGIPYRAHGAVALWLLGQRDQAVERGRSAVEEARQKLELYSMAIALFNLAKIHQLRNEPEATADLSSALLTLSQEQSFPVWHAAGTVLSGWAQCHAGQARAGAARIHRGLAAFQAAGAAMLRPYFLGLFAESLAMCGRPAPGLKILERALQVAATTQEAFFVPELHRLRGELLLQLPDAREHQEAAGACFDHAQSLARSQTSRSLELRAGTSASRLAGNRR